MWHSRHAIPQGSQVVFSETSLKAKALQRPQCLIEALCALGALEPATAFHAVLRRAHLAHAILQAIAFLTLFASQRIFLRCPDGSQGTLAGTTCTQRHSKQECQPCPPRAGRSSCSSRYCRAHSSGQKEPNRSPPVTLDKRTSPRAWHLVQVLFGQSRQPVRLH